ncbi:MAG: NAD(P)-binding protein [Acidobacteriota bacterium]
MKRRDFLIGSAGVAASMAVAGCASPGGRRGVFEGRIVGANQGVGHLLRQGGLPAPTSERRVAVVIVGGGVAGLSAGWKLRKSGFTDFEILELESETGGNARSGRNQVSAYPWGAHYVPFPTRESRAVRELFDELGIIQGYDASGKPFYDETFVCSAPEERLFINGKWQDGLVPLLGVGARDLGQLNQFRDLMAGYRERRDAAGRPAFAIPMDLSARDADLLALDRISMREFLLARKLDAPSLHWYVDYCCRDDYGSFSSDVSAWAGVHYFASREGESARVSDATLLTWPEGIGWIVERLARALDPHVTRGALVFRVDPTGTGASVDVYHPGEKRTTRLVADDVVFACPSVFARHTVSTLSAEVRRDLDQFEYAPWMVANLTLREFPAARPGVPLAWDNVVYQSPSLGYVVATHQSLQSRPRQTVLTFYHALAGRPTADARARLMAPGWQGWADFAINDLSRPHPDIASLVTGLDVMLWGHAMVCPRPGFVWGGARQRMAAIEGPLHFAHSDLSGLSLFEEAQYRGIRAAERVLRRHHVAHTSSL